MIYTISKVAQRWECDYKTVKNEMVKGKLKYFTFGSEKKPQYRIREEWVREYEESEVR